MYFFTTENMADVKFETDIVENVFSRWKRKQLTIHFLLLWSCYDHERHVL